MNRLRKNCSEERQCLQTPLVIRFGSSQCRNMPLSYNIELVSFQKVLGAKVRVPDPVLNHPSRAGASRWARINQFLSALGKHTYLQIFTAPLRLGAFSLHQHHHRNQVPTPILCNDVQSALVNMGRAHLSSGPNDTETQPLLWSRANKINTRQEQRIKHQLLANLQDLQSRDNKNHKQHPSTGHCQLDTHILAWMKGSLRTIELN